MKMRPEGVELFHTEGRTYNFTQLYERALKEVSYPCQHHEGI